MGHQTMKPRHQVSRQAIELIKRFEGYRRGAAALPDGRWTIGYGHTKTARGGVEVSEKDAEALLIYDLLEVTKAVNDWTFTPLTQNQFDALVCFASNVGLENFRRSSVLRRVNEGAMLQAACALEMWRKAEFEGERIVVDALVRRRAAEKALFLTPTHGWVPAPSPVVRPRVDYDASAAQPKQRPLSLIVPLDGAEANAHEEPRSPTVSDEPEEPSPATTAAENLTARLHALVPEPSPQEGTAEADAGLDLPSPPAPSAPVDEPEPQAAPAPTLAEAIVPAFAPEVEPSPAFALTPPPVEPEAEEEAPAAFPAAPDPDARPLPFSEPMQAPSAFSLRPLAQSAAPSPRIEQDDAFTFDQGEAAAPAASHADFDLERAAPMKFELWPLVALLGGGLVCLGFAFVWALFAKPGTSFFGPWIIAWAAGLLGIGCIVGALYMLLERLGGSEE
jgi:lysozyme